MMNVRSTRRPVEAPSAAVRPDGAGPVAAGAPDLLAREFAAAYRRELSQRCDVGTAEASMRAAASATRGLLATRWALTQAADAMRGSRRRVHYLSMEFLMGRAMSNALAALGLNASSQELLGAQGPALAEVLAREPDAALGNGGLGRLAACFLDAMATLGLPSFGYGLRYEHGMFAQAIEAGQQVERPDQWLEHGNPWELLRPEVRYSVGFGGAMHPVEGEPRWVPAEVVIAQAHDFIVPGHGTEHVSTLRQWHARAARPIDFMAFCRGDHAAAASHKQTADALNWVLYPDDSTPAGRELRLKQEYFLVSASLQDMLARHVREGGNLRAFGEANAVHLNDTHPALVPAELMRLLVDDHGLGWDEAWAVTTRAVSYTNHTLMPEALETWELPMFEAMLPRHLQIIYEINHRLLREVRARHPGDDALAERVSLIDERGSKRVRMAALAIAASRKVNGVSALHSQLMVDTIFSDHARLWPDRFINITNGVTPRRWLMQANPGLAALIDTRLGEGWRRDLGQLQGLATHAGDQALGEAFLRVKHANKQRLAQLIERELGIAVDAASLFDVQIKRIHEYKRQLLNVLHVIARYQAIVADPHRDWVPRTVVFAGKAASAYVAAKQVIRLIHDVAAVVNHDPRVGARLKVVFLPNYGVTLAESILPAADLSQQISTAGTEASGTGNMKFALNGALTIGTWDGANIEMALSMGEEQMFVFGLRADAVARIRGAGYDPAACVAGDVRLATVIEALERGDFSPAEPERYHTLTHALRHDDRYLLCADFADYLRAQDEVDALFRQPQAWAARAWRNVAAMGPFSVDRTIAQYAAQVWS